ncbi:hypothetical protein [uncultured Ruegeria sp.]|uniref:hypothetical protein n=1 Tax=uncultured Ruegeria sp. TaxID=259304 RepID=UPI00261D9FC3|nr:hypothetical protein [uncultured Ruegeria sp.]
MSNLNNRLQKLEAHSSEPKVHYTWVEPGSTEEQLEAHVKEVRREKGLSDDTKVIAIHWNASEN